MAMDDWKNKRKEWRDKRDGFKVKQGAVSGVSIGDALDKVYKEAGKGYQPLLKATAALRKDLAKYVAKSDKGAAKFVSWINGTLVKELDKLEDDAETDVRTLKALDAEFTDFSQTCVPGFPDSGLVQNVRKRMDADKVDWAEAAKTAGIYASLRVVVPKWVAFIKRQDAMTFKLQLPGKSALYDTLRGDRDTYRKGAALLAKFPACKSLEEHALLMKQASSVISDVDNSPYYQDWNRALKELMG